MAKVLHPLKIGYDLTKLETLAQWVSFFPRLHRLVRWYESGTRTERSCLPAATGGRYRPTATSIHCQSKRLRCPMPVNTRSQPPTPLHDSLALQAYLLSVCIASSDVNKTFSRPRPKPGLLLNTLYSHQCSRLTL